MREPSLGVSRRTLLGGVGAGLLPLAIGGATADPVSDAVDEAVSSAPSVFGEVGRRINEVRYPLVGVPSIREPGETLRVELDLTEDEVPSDASLEADGAIAASLVPSFGAARTETTLPRQSVDREDSAIWRGETYVVARFTVPKLDERFTESLYDLHVRFPGGTDGQPRAVSVHRSFPREPQVAVMGDPHAGDPRPVQDGAERSAEEGDPGPFLYRYGETFGTGTEDDRWGAWQRANAELNAQAPDLVLVIGDLAAGSTFYYQEYEDAYRILNQLDAPTFVTLGNHDGYVTPGAGTDGKELWRRYFAPWFYSVDLRPDLHFVSLDTYDWPAMDRIAPSAVPSTWGGQVRDPQLEWLADDLRSWREANPAGTVLTLSHHNPSWRQTDGDLEGEVRGVPAAEQAVRGAERAGGGWAGANRIAVRNLLRETGVSLHVSGHAHRDRVARDDGRGNVVATTGTGLEYVAENHDETGPVREDDDPEDVLVDGEAPLYLEATTAASGTDQYWGWRTVPLRRNPRPVDPTRFGYPATDGFLEERALDPEAWSAENADLGLYSTPSYLLDATLLESSPRRVSIRIESALVRDFSGAVTLPLVACRGVRVENGTRRWRRVTDDWQDVRVAFEVPAGGTVEVTAECRQAAASK